MVKLEADSKGSGYFLTIGDNIVENTWAVTEEEMFELYEKLTDVLYKDESVA